MSARASFGRLSKAYHLDLVPPSSSIPYEINSCPSYRQERLSTGLGC